MPKLKNLVINQTQSLTNHLSNLNLASSKAGPPYIHQPCKIRSKTKSNNLIHEPYLMRASCPPSLKCPLPIHSLIPLFHPPQPPTHRPQAPAELGVCQSDLEIRSIFRNFPDLIILIVFSWIRSGVLIKVKILSATAQLEEIFSFFTGSDFGEALGKLSKNNQGAKREVYFLASEFEAFRILDSGAEANEATWAL